MFVIMKRPCRDLVLGMVIGVVCGVGVKVEAVEPARC